MSNQSGFAVAYGVAVRGTVAQINDAQANDFYNAHLAQSADLREEPDERRVYKNLDGDIKSLVLSGTRRRMTITLVPTNGEAGATGGIALAEDQIKLPPVGEIITLVNWISPGVTSAPFNGQWYYTGSGRILTTNAGAARLEIEIEQFRDSSGSAVALTLIT